MKKTALLVVLLVALCVPGIAMGATSVSKDELVVLRDDLGNEIWGPTGGSGDGHIFAITNETLVSWAQQDQDQGYYPRLAERWEMSKDGLIWDFYLRKGIQFHDGWGEFTAEDVKYTIELMGSDGSGNVHASRFRSGGKKGNLSKITVVNPYQIRIELKKPEVMFLWLLCEDSSAIVSKKHYESVGKKAVQHPIGTGSYRFIEHKPAQYIAYEAVNNHWRKTPGFKKLTIKAVPEQSSRLAMLKGGHADVSIIPADRAGEMEKAGIKVKRLPETLHVSWVLGGSVLPTREHYDPECPWVYHQDEPWDSDWNQRALKVRKALSHAINYPAIIDKIMYGEAKATPFHGWVPVGTWSNPQWKPYEYNPDLSKKLL